VLILPFGLLWRAVQAIFVFFGASMFLTYCHPVRVFLLSSLLLTASLASAQPAPVKIEGAWARATVAGQQGTGAFMSITASEGLRLVGLSSPVAGVAEVHEMKMEGDVMKMRAIAGLDLPAGQTVQLKPGSYHLMLMDLKRPLVKDSTIPVTLRFQNAKGVESKFELTLPVSLKAPGAAAAAPAVPAKLEQQHKH
jgi:copper(I)-binding protein